MILEISALLAKLVPGSQKDPVDVVCVRTTRPKFLVFHEDASKPAYVVQFGNQNELERLHGILQRLHQKLPDMIAESLVCLPWGQDRFVHIQRGLAGIPWFRLEDHFRSPGEWSRLKERALQALERLHTAIREIPEWSGPINPEEELRRVLRLGAERGIIFSSRAQEGISRACERLETLGEISGFYQHGDFCFNNILVAPENLAIIDFDEFGLTSMPLHDEIGLALSFQLLAPQGESLGSLVEDLEACLRLPENSLKAHHLPGLFLHHLLWRINQCHAWPTRAQMRMKLIALVEEFFQDGIANRFYAKLNTDCGLVLR